MERYILIRKSSLVILLRDCFQFNCKKGKELKVYFLMATPPCQGMSTAGVQDENDERYKLIFSVIKIAKLIKPIIFFPLN